MKRTILFFVQDILDAIKRIESFVGAMSYEDFRRDDKTSAAVIWNIHVIGEATKNLPKSIQTKYPGIPWKNMAGMRDRIAHSYFGIDFDIVWDVVKKQLPSCKPHIEKILKELKEE